MEVKFQPTEKWDIVWGTV